MPGKFNRHQIILITVVCLLFIVSVSAFYFKVADEISWIRAGSFFRDALVELQADKTYVPEVSHRLGVTVLWVSSFIYFVFGSLPMSYLVVIHRLVFLILNLLLFGCALVLLKRHAAKNVLLLFVFYMFMNRFFPIIGRSTWLDQFLTMFGFLSILLWIRYLTDNKRFYLITAGILNGLLMLTKYAGWYFSLIVVCLSIVYFYKKKRDFKKLLLPLTVFLSISVVVFILLYPAVWVDPRRALLLRWEVSSAPKTIADIWEYISEIRLIDPVLIFGFIFTVLDWKKKKDFLYYIGLAGVLYVSVYLLTFIALILVGRLNTPFLMGIYRYTFPAIPFLAFYTFNRYKTYIINRKLQIAFVLFLFAREIVFSPFLLF